MWGDHKDKSRLSAIEALLEKHDNALEEFAQNQVELSSDIRSIAESLERHAAHEEVTTSNHVKLLVDVNTNLSDIRTALVAQPKDVEIRVARERDYLINEFGDKFATKETIRQELINVRRDAKIIWSVVGTIGAGIIATLQLTGAQ